MSHNAPAVVGGCASRGWRMRQPWLAIESLQQEKERA